MRPLSDWQFDPTRPLQTKRGAKQALRCGEDKLEELIERRVLKTVNLGPRLVRVTTESIMRAAATGDQQSQDQ